MSPYPKHRSSLAQQPVVGLGTHVFCFPFSQSPSHRCRPPKQGQGSRQGGSSNGLLGLCCPHLGLLSVGQLFQCWLFLCWDWSAPLHPFFWGDPFNSKLSTLRISVPMWEPSFISSLWRCTSGFPSPPSSALLLKASTSSLFLLNFTLWW